jgi:tRNA A37 threonylcarbamoyladenosine modification protein TsaB
MNAASPETVLVVNPVATPLQFALYREGKLERSWEREGYASDWLVTELDRLLEASPPAEILYVNGPGSQMGIKLAYLTLRTLELLRGIPFGAVSAFALNGGRPLKAMGRLYFVKEKETIMTKSFQEPIAQEFSFPSTLEALEREPDNRPDYRLPAV